MDTIGVWRKPKARRERGGHLAGRKDGSGETITLKSENARNLI
jgi:hypothetical protein